MAKNSGRKSVQALPQPLTNLLIREVPTVTTAGEETDQQISARIGQRFDVFAQMVDAVVSNDIRSLIVSGPPGIGKSFLLEKKLAEFDPTCKEYCITKGYVRATGLARLLWEYRRPGQILVFDDADQVLFDETSLAFLKSACDSGDVRTICRLSEYRMFDSEGMEIPTRFDYEGTIVFITNIDFDALAEKNKKIGVHLKALMSRSLYIDLDMKTRRDIWIRVKAIVDEGKMLTALTKEQAEDTMKFVEEHMATVRELSLRTVLKVASLRKNGHEKWAQIAKVTCLKQR